MVRLEKILYEKAINNPALGRARKITTPAKWFRVNSLDHMQKFGYEFYNKTLLGRLLNPFVEFWRNFERDFQRDILLQQGLTFEDKFLHADAQLRRNVLHEHIYRESLHPYHWVLKGRRRERYYKVERALRGFFVPEYIRSEAKTQTYLDFKRLQKEWTTFIFSNYFSDMTPTAKKTTFKAKIPLDWALNYGFWKSEAWERYFFNSRDKGWFTPEEVAITNDPKRFPYNLTTSQGKRQFEKYYTEINEKHPGIVAPEGQKFDFKKHYAEIGV